MLSITVVKANSGSWPNCWHRGAFDGHHLSGNVYLSFLLLS